MEKEYEVEIKKNSELEDCAEGSQIILIFNTSEEYHGIFRGFDGEDTIMLRSEGEKPMTIGLPFDKLKCWLLKL